MTRNDSRQPVVSENDIDYLVFLNKNKFLVSKTDKEPVYLATDSAFDDGGSIPPKLPVDPTPPKPPVDPTPPVVKKDVPDLSDIESITFQEDYDPATKLTTMTAFIKIRNSSFNKENIAGIDARIFNDKAPANPSGTPAVDSKKFIAPTPTVPAVTFSRYGSSNTSLAWGWNNSTGLGSYTSVSYEWIISSSAGKNASALDSGTKEFVSSASKTIGDSGKTRTYRVSSYEGDTTATSNPRWLRVRAVVVGTNGKKYYSQYSTPK
jgi:hypothetical protein